MLYTNYNVDHPLKIDQQLMSDKVKGVYYVSKAEYELIKDKDPLAFYVIRETGQIFKGANSNPEPSIVSSLRNKYFMTISDDCKEFLICIAFTDINRQSFIIEIERYNNEADAFNALKRYNFVTSHREVPNNIQTLLNQFEEKNISFLDLVYGIISCFGYRNDPRFVQLVNVINAYCTPLNSTVQINYIPNVIHINKSELMKSENFLFNKFFKIISVLQNSFLNKKVNRRYQFETKDVIIEIINLF